MDYFVHIFPFGSLSRRITYHGERNIRSMKFKELSPKPDFSEIQPEILEFWKKDGTFEKSVSQPDKGEIVFYDGPPFPTGKPHHATPALQIPLISPSGGQ